MWQAAAAESIWVTDEVTVNVLSRPASSARILRTVRSGDELEQVRRSNRYTLVSVPLPDGGTKRGWVLNDLLEDSPPPEVALEIAEKTAKDLTAANQSLLEQQQSLADELHSVHDDLRVKTRDLENLQQQYSALENTSKSAVQLADSNAKLQASTQAITTEMVALQQENEQLRDMQLLYWALAGAGVLVLGVLLGLIIPKLAGKRDDRWV